MKRIKTILLAIVAGAFVINANGQALKKAVLGVEDFTYSKDFSIEDVEMIRNQIINGIRNTGRVIVVDHHSATNKALSAERERRKQESAMDANEVADMTSLNANSLLSANLDQLIATREIYKETEMRKVGDKYETVVKGEYPYYKAVITYTLKITDCETGSVQSQETYQFSAGNYSTLYHKADYDNPKAAIEALLSRCVNQDQLTILILNTFKAEGKVLQIEKGNGKKAQTVYISLGSEDGIQEGQVLELYREIDIAGEISRKLVGEVEVIELLGATRSLAKVKKGGDVIQQVLAVGGNLPVRSRDVKQKFFGGIK